MLISNGDKNREPPKRCLRSVSRPDDFLELKIPAPPEATMRLSPSKVDLFARQDSQTGSTFQTAYSACPTLTAFGLRSENAGSPAFSGVGVACVATLLRRGCSVLGAR
jgi:hypothetical protein